MHKIFTPKWTNSDGDVFIKPCLETKHATLADAEANRAEFDRFMDLFKFVPAGIQELNADDDGCFDLTYIEAFHEVIGTVMVITGPNFGKWMQPADEETDLGDFFGDDNVDVEDMAVIGED